jgi:hypothetical protein
LTHLFVSDLHLDAAAPAATEQFLAFLSGAARRAESLYILGDLFESWIGDDDDDPERDRVCRASRYAAIAISCSAPASRRVPASHCCRIPCSPISTGNASC